MRSGTIAWLLGTLTLHHLAALPDLPWGILVVCCAPLLALPGRWRLPAWYLAGFLWTGFTAQALLAERPESGLLQRDIVVRGVVTGVPQLEARRTRFEFAPEHLLKDGAEEALQGLWRLSWYQDPPALRPGQLWQLKVRLTIPKQALTPGSFDYQKYLFRNRITALGYVREDSANVMHAETGWRRPLDRLRARLAERIGDDLGPAYHSGIIAALTVGVRQDLEPAARELLRRTGTAHLMAISGLHVAIAASLGFVFGRGSWHLLGAFRQRFPVSKLAAVGALLTATAYAALAGFSLPTQRALVMLGTAVVALLADRGKTGSQVYCWALLVVLVWDPLATLDGGFWLSFGAVAALMLAYSTQIRRPGAVREWFRVQCLLAIALLPLMVGFFGVVNLATVPANLIAVPWTAATIVPLALLGALLELLGDGWGTVPWQIAARAYSALEVFLVWIDGLDLLHPVRPPSFAVMALTVVGVLLLLSPRGFPGRWLGLLCLSALLFLPFPRSTAELELIVFETGRGYCTVLRSPELTVVYDAGPRYSTRSDFANAVLVPYLKNQGVDTIDALVISRPLASRVGGSRSLQEAFAVNRILVPSRAALPIQRAESCDGAHVGHPGALQVRSEHTQGGTSRCRIRISWGEKELALLDPDADSPTGSEAGIELLRQQTPEAGPGGILQTRVYALDGLELMQTESLAASRLRYWHH